MLYLLIWPSSISAARFCCTMKVIMSMNRRRWRGWEWWWRAQWWSSFARVTVIAMLIRVVSEDGGGRRSHRGVNLSAALCTFNILHPLAGCHDNYSVNTLIFHWSRRSPPLPLIHSLIVSCKGCSVIYGDLNSSCCYTPHTHTHVIL